MSNIAPHLKEECNALKSNPAIEFLLQPKDKDIGGFSVRRSLPTKQKRQVGPWVFFDHMGPADFPPGKGIDVRPHPHIGLATVTYLFEGEMLHRDSLGNEQAIYPGDMNLMAAGHGIVHSERESDAVRSSPHKLHGLQLWLALPKDKEEMDPGFFHYDREEIPSLQKDGIDIRVLIGEAFGVTSPVITFAETLYFEAYFNTGDSLILPNTAERAVYVVEGSLMIDGTELPTHSMAILTAKENVQITATETARIAVIGGEVFDKRYMDWNFISTRKDRVEVAKKDWEEGRFPKVPGDEEEFMPLPR